MTTQSPPQLCSRPSRTSRPTLLARSADAGPDARTVPAKAADVQTRLPWWAVALPALAFATLLAMLSGGSAHAGTATSGGDLLGRMVTVLADLAHHLL